MPDEQQKNNAVESHEIWEWHVPDPSVGVGIQKLKKIITVCVDCHMMFHEGFAVSQAKLYSDAEKVSEFIKAKQMLVNRVDRVELEAQLASEKDRAESQNGIDKWVIDLSHLSNQDYMQSNRLIFNDDNLANVAPDTITGIEFELQDGEVIEAKDAITVYNKLVSDVEVELYEDPIYASDRENSAFS